MTAAICPSLLRVAWARDSVPVGAMAMLRKGDRESTKRNMPKRWFHLVPHAHVALDDAIEQGRLFCNMGCLIGQGLRSVDLIFMRHRVTRNLRNHGKEPGRWTCPPPRRISLIR